MAVATKSVLSGKIGNKLAAAIMSHKDDETTIKNFGDLPPNLSGVAQLVDCKFGVIDAGKTNAGEVYFYAAGIVVEPTYFTDANGNEIEVAGLRTSITETIADTPNAAGARKTVDDHIAWVLNEMRKLGIDTASFTGDSEEVEQAAAMLVEVQPFFKFRTWQGKPTAQYPEPRINHNWNGLAEGYVREVTEGEGVEDNTPPEEPVKAPPITKPTPVKPSAAVAPPAKAPPAKTPPKPAPAPEPVPEPEPEPVDAGIPVVPYPLCFDVQALLAAANAGDADAAESLGVLAINAGVAEELVSEAQTWDEVVDLINSASGIPDDQTIAESAPAFEVGKVCQYHPMDPKTKKKMAKAISCEVVAVSADGATVDLKNLATKMLYKKVKVEELS